MSEVAESGLLWLLSTVCVSVIAACHWGAVLLASQSDQQQQRWASLGGGAGLAYVFVHLLPELASGGSELSEAIGMVPLAPTHLIESLLFFVSLVGIWVVFSIDVLARRQTSFSPISAWLHLGSFAAINYLYAYSLPSLISTGILYGILFTVAISTHVLLADRFSAVHHPKRFRRRSRWLGSGALAFGLLNSFFWHPISDLTLGLATAFLGGGLLMTVFREELPAASSARLIWFLSGSIGMGILLVIPLLSHSLGR